MVSMLVAGVMIHAVLAVSTIHGEVAGPDGKPIANAHVFLESNIESVLRDTVTNTSGQFSFEDVAAGAVGIFAIAPGYGFEGQHVNIALDGDAPLLKIVLHEATTINGTIANSDGVPIAGARVTRIAVKGTHKVGIPFAKLATYGYVEPTSDAKGQFQIAAVPRGCKVDLKVGHPSFAQEGVMDVPAGADRVAVSLYPGVLVEGGVFMRGEKIPVGQADVLVRNAQPPHDTATAQTNLQGIFSLRLKPGVYLYRAEGAGMRSAGWERLAITGERPVEHVRVAVAGTGTVRGDVRDALTGEPVRDVRISLTTNGTRAAVVRTGPGGDFRLLAGEGENAVRLSETPGYYPPDTQQVKVVVTDGDDVQLPTMWLKPLPAYQVVIVDEDQRPVPGALVTVMRPRQFGWYVAGADGVVDINVRAFPEDGVLLARTEHPSLAKAALFRLEQSQRDAATVQLFDVATVEGSIVTSRGAPLVGASVGAFFPGESAADATLLWQTFSDSNGRFAWKSVVPGVPVRCAARTAGDGSGESATMNLAPGAHRSDVEIVVDGGKDGRSQLGKTLEWYRWDVRCGALPPPDVCAQRPTMLVYVRPGSLSIYMESLAQLKALVDRPELMIVLVAEGAVDCADGELPVLAGAPDGEATVILLDQTGTVTFESTGMPPIHYLRTL